MPDIITALKSSVSTALDDSGVQLAYVFGSQVTGRTHPESDIDIGVWLGAEPVEDRTDIVLDLTARLADSSGLGDIEVTVLNWAPLRVTGRVLSEGVLLFSRDEPARIIWESRMLREFWDFRLRADQVDREALRKMARGER